MPRPPVGWPLSTDSKRVGVGVTDEARAGLCSPEDLPRPLTSSFPFRLSKLVKKRKPSWSKPFSSTMRAEGFPSLGQRAERRVRAHSVFSPLPLAWDV